MFSFIKNVIGTDLNKSSFDAASPTHPDINASFSETARRKRETKVTRAQTKKATRMKLERILEKTEKRR
jgi:hypothetical protein